MSPEMLGLLVDSFWETMYMVVVSTFLATAIGLRSFENRLIFDGSVAFDVLRW